MSAIIMTAVVTVPSLRELAQTPTVNEVAESDSNTGPGDAKAPLVLFAQHNISEAQNGPVFVNILGEL